MNIRWGRRLRSKAVLDVTPGSRQRTCKCAAARRSVGKSFPRGKSVAKSGTAPFPEARAASEGSHQARPFLGRKRSPSRRREPRHWQDHLEPRGRDRCCRDRPAPCAAAVTATCRDKSGTPSNAGAARRSSSGARNSGTRVPALKPSNSHPGNPRRGSASLRDRTLRAT